MRRLCKDKGLLLTSSTHMAVVILGTEITPIAKMHGIQTEEQPVIILSHEKAPRPSGPYFACPIPSSLVPAFDALAALPSTLMSLFAAPSCV